MKFFKLSILLSLLFLASCVSHLPLAMDETTGYFPASKKLPEKGIKVSIKTSGLPHYSFLNLRTYLHSRDNIVRSETNQLIHDAFTKLGFRKIVKNHELRTLSGNVAPHLKINDINDIGVLHEISKKTGRFLVAEVSTRYIHLDRHNFRVNLIDPYIGKVVFSAEITTVVWSNYPKELYYPVLNAVFDWYKKQEFIKEANKTAI